MSNMKFKNYSLFFLIIGLFVNVSLQAQAPVVVKINADSIQIGDAVSMEFIVNTNGGISIEKVSFANYDSIESVVRRPTTEGSEVFYADFEMQGYGAWKSPGDDKKIIFEKPDLNWTTQEGNNNLQRNVLTFTIWNEGIYLLPPVQITFNRGGRTYTQNSNKIPLVVGSPLVEAAMNQQDSIALSDIKPIIEEPVKFQDYIPYIIGVILLIHLICLIYFLMNNQQKVELLPIPVMQMTSHDLAANKLTILKNGQLWQQGKAKEYLSKLTFIVREYLENRYDIPALESTSGQILQKMKTVQLPQNVQTDLRELFQKSDLVKFAKAEPQPDFLENSYAKAANLVKETQTGANEIWVEVNKVSALRNSENSMNVVEETFRVTDNLEELTNPKKLIYAGFGERFAARLLDFFFFSIIYGSVFFLISWQGTDGGNIRDLDVIGSRIGYPVIISFFIISWLYYAFAEFKKGATFGKMILDLQVTNLEGENISLLKSTLRWFGKVLSESFLFFANFWFYFDKNRMQTLYDRFSKTIVIKK